MNEVNEPFRSVGWSSPGRANSKCKGPEVVLEEHRGQYSWRGVKAQEDSGSQGQGLSVNHFLERLRDCGKGSGFYSELEVFEGFRSKMDDIR
jgi:hypothetical protein